MTSISIPNTNLKGLNIAANIYYPEGFDKSKTYPGILVAHPIGGVKEQTASIYSQHLAKHGYVMIAFDASYQGASDGEPRQLENPYTRVEDFSAVVDYMVAQPFIDSDRIGVLGVCGGGAYAANAAMNDHRIKAIGTVSAVNVGDMFRRGWDGKGDPSQALAVLNNGSQARSQQATGQAAPNFPWALSKKEDAPTAELAEAFDYYRTPRAQHPNAPSEGTTRSFTQLGTYDAFHLIDLFLTQPIRSIVGADAATKWSSEDLINKAASEDKKLHQIQGFNHFQMYDRPRAVEEAVSILAPFYEANL